MMAVQQLGSHLAQAQHLLICAVDKNGVNEVHVVHGSERTDVKPDDEVIPHWNPPDDNGRGSWYRNDLMGKKHGDMGKNRWD
jgi:hypothetical protein